MLQLRETDPTWSHDLGLDDDFALAFITAPAAVEQDVAVWTDDVPRVGQRHLWTRVAEGHFEMNWASSEAEGGVSPPAVLAEGRKTRERKQQKSHTHLLVIEPVPWGATPHVRNVVPTVRPTTTATLLVAARNVERSAAGIGMRKRPR